MSAARRIATVRTAGAGMVVSVEGQSVELLAETGETLTVPLRAVDYLISALVKAKEAGQGPAPTEASFQAFMRAFPLRDLPHHRHRAFYAYQRAMRSGTSGTVILSAASKYAEAVSRSGKSRTSYVENAWSWLERRGWLDEFDVAPARRFHMV
jgi:hypothetical protein